MAILKNLGKWQNYAHYILLTAWIFYPTHYYSSFIEEKVVSGLWYGWILLFIWYVFFIFIGDTLVHALFYILPKPIQWRD